MPDMTALLSDVKDYLNITWQDEKTDKKITGYINRGMARLQFIAGASLDFKKEDLPRSLLLDYCRYANSQALEVFETNFQSELLELNLMHQAATVGALAVASVTGTVAGKTTIIVAPSLTDGDSYMYQTGTAVTLPGLFDICDTVAKFTAWDGSAEIAATSNSEIMIVEVDENYKAVRAGKTIVKAG